MRGPVLRDCLCVICVLHCSLNDAIPREFLESFEAAGLVGADRKQLLGLDIPRE